MALAKSGRRKAAENVGEYLRKHRRVAYFELSTRGGGGAAVAGTGGGGGSTFKSAVAAAIAGSY